MSKKTLFWLATWYVAGSIIASLYSKKTSTTLKKEVLQAKTEWQTWLEVLFDNFIKLHKDLFFNLKDDVILTEENKSAVKRKVSEWRDRLSVILNSYKVKAKWLIAELEREGKTYLVEASKKLEALYKEKEVEVKSLKDTAPEKIADLKAKLKASFEEAKEEMRNLVNKG